MKYNKNWGKIDTIRDRTTEQDSKLSAPHDFYYFRLNLLSSTSVSNLFLLLPSQTSFFYFRLNLLSSTSLSNLFCLLWSQSSSSISFLFYLFVISSQISSFHFRLKLLSVFVVVLLSLPFVTHPSSSYISSPCFFTAFHSFIHLTGSIWKQR